MSSYKDVGMWGMWKNLALVGATSASLPGMNESHIDEHILGLVTHPLTKHWENALSLSGGIPSDICTMAGITIFVDRYIFGSIFPFIGQYHYISSLFGQYLASHFQNINVPVLLVDWLTISSTVIR